MIILLLLALFLPQASWAEPFMATPPPATVANREITLAIDVATDRRTISQHIYGIHDIEDEDFMESVALPVRRWGGKDTTRYNWKNNMYGNPDWYFENEEHTTSVTDFIDQNQAADVASIVTIPMIGYVAKDPGETGKPATYPCSFDTRIYPYIPQPYPYNRQPATDPADPTRAHCSSGILAYEDGDQRKPIYFVGNNPLDTSMVITPAWATEFINYLKDEFGAADDGGVRFYSLDNEPDRWFDTHRDVAPVALTFAHLRDRSYQYAAAIKAADPNALTLGPVLHGWTYYWHSPSDGQASLWATRPDRQQYGDMPLVAWYLQQMAAYEQANGVRLLDYLDLHYYVAAEGVSQAAAGDAATQARRLRSTRSLWDATYEDESWISSAPVTDGNQIVPDYKRVRLIPRMREWRDRYYPGTKLAITEYNWGALDHINGALAQADVLGIFGREGLDLALLVDSPSPLGGQFTPDGPGAFAFRIYRNYDGEGNQFGNISVRATSSDPDQLAIYAAQRHGDQALTAVVINKTDQALTANLAIANFTLADQVQVYRYSAANADAIQQQADLAVTGNSLTTTFPAYSITLLHSAKGVTPLPTPTPIADPITDPISDPIGTSIQSLYLPMVRRQ
jgi:Glycoside hydrolase family 44